MSTKSSTEQPCTKSNTVKPAQMDHSIDPDPWSAWSLDRVTRAVTDTNHNVSTGS